MLTNLCIYPHLRVAYISTINSGKNVGPYIRDIILINMGKWEYSGEMLVVYNNYALDNNP